MRGLIGEAGPLGLDVALLDERERLIASGLDDIQVAEGRARRIGQEDVLINHPLIAELERDPFAPAQPGDRYGEEVRGLIQRGIVVQSDGVLFASSSIEQAAVAVARLLQLKPGGVTVAEIRDALGTTRKFALPICAILDSTGVTRRREDLRIPGPRLPDL